MVLTLADCPHDARLYSLSVSDTGRGIEPEDLQRIFERLYQAKEGDWAQEGGMGLGLYLSQQIAKLHGSELRVESRVGEGSRFYFDVLRA